MHNSPREETLLYIRVGNWNTLGSRRPPFPPSEEEDYSQVSQENGGAECQENHPGVKSPETRTVARRHLV